MPQNIPGLFPVPPVPVRKPTRQEELDYYIKTREAQSKWSPLRKFGTGIIEGLGGGSAIFDEPEDKAKDLGKLFGEFNPIGMIGGLAAPALMKRLGISKVFHGTPNLKSVLDEGFDESLYNRSDTLGWMTHATDRPEWAGDFAAKGGTTGGGIIPARIEATNVYNARPYEDFAPARFGGPKKATDIESLESAIEDIRKINRHYDLPEGINYPLNFSLEQAIKSGGKQKFLDSGFDAIRYTDVSQPSWAVPNPNQFIESLSGMPSRVKVGGKGRGILPHSSLSSNPSNFNGPNVNGYEIFNPTTGETITLARNLQEFNSFIRNNKDKISNWDFNIIRDSKILSNDSNEVGEALALWTRIQEQPFNANLSGIKRR